MYILMNHRQEKAGTLYRVFWFRPPEQCSFIS